MRHVISRNVLGFPHVIEIQPEEYSLAVESKVRLLAAVAMEEKFSILVANYAEYERTLLEMALGHMVHIDFDYFSMHDDMQLVNRRLANLFTSGRMYIDQVRQDAREIGAMTIEEIETILSIQYDSRLGNRVIEALRNYAQHRSLPVGQIGVQLTAVERHGVRLSKHGINVNLDVALLRETGGFKSTVLNELKGKYVPLTPLVREHLEGLPLRMRRFVLESNRSQLRLRRLLTASFRGLGHSGTRPRALRHIDTTTWLLAPGEGVERAEDARLAADRVVAAGHGSTGSKICRSLTDTFFSKLLVLPHQLLCDAVPSSARSFASRAPGSVRTLI